MNIKNKTFRYIIKSDRRLARAAAVLMLLSGVVRILYYRFLFHSEVELSLFFGQILLPLVCVFGLAAFAFTDKIRLTIFPALAGAAFFIIKAADFAPLHKLLCVFLYLLVGILYTVTLLGVFPKKLPLVLVFAIPLAVHIGMDIYEFATYENIVPVDYLPELSVLLIMAALLLYSCSLHFTKENIRINRAGI